MENLHNSFMVSQLDLSDCKLAAPVPGIYNPKLLVNKRKCSEKQYDFFMYKTNSSAPLKEEELKFIENKEFRQRLYDLCKDHDHTLYRKLVDKWKPLHEKRTEFQFKALWKWHYDMIELFDFTYYDHYIRFNKYGFAERGKDLILFVDDYRLRNKDGSFGKYTEEIAIALNKGQTVKKRGESLPGIFMKDVAKMAAKLFYFILTGNKVFTMELYVWHVFEFMLMNTDIREGAISCKEIYRICLLEACRSNKSVPKLYTNSKGAKKKIYIIEGKTKKETYGKYMDDKRKEDLKNSFIYCRQNNIELTEDNILHTYKWIIGGKCNNSKKYGLGTMHKSTLVKYVEEMKKDSAYRVFIGDGFVRKTHKQQERSKWHEMVDLSVKAKDNYNEIIQVYPDVRYTAYYKQRQRQIKIGQNC